MPHTDYASWSYLAIRGGVPDAEQLAALSLATVTGPTLLAHFEKGTADIAARIVPMWGAPWRLVYVRCHLVGGTGENALVLGLDSGAGDDWDTKLYQKDVVGVNNDLNLRFEADETAWPSPWSFGSRDSLNVTWTNPETDGSMAWGLEVGVAVVPPTGGAFNARV